MLTDLAEYLAGQGHLVSVICSRQLYGNPGAALATNEILSGVKVHRMATTRFGRNNLVGRTIDYLSFYFSASIWLFRHIHKGDTIIAKTDPPLISFFAALVAKIKGAKLINWLQDLFPEVAFALGINMPTIFKAIILSCRNFSLRMATINVAIGEKMVTRLQSIPRVSHIEKIDNWAPGDFIRPISRVDNILRHEWQLDNKFVAGYSGNLGRAHDIDTLIEAAKLLSNTTNITFLLIGSGAQRIEIENQARNAGLKNITFKPYQPIETLAMSLSVADVHVVTLNPLLEGLIVPSKFYGIAAAGRPSIFIGDQSGEIASLVEKYQCGYTVGVGDAQQLASYIFDLSLDPQKLSDLGTNAFAAATGPLNRTARMRTWEESIKSTTSSFT